MKRIHSHLVVSLVKEKVSVIEGSREYLQALGFESTALPVDGEGNAITFQRQACHFFNAEPSHISIPE